MFPSGSAGRSCHTDWETPDHGSVCSRHHQLNHSRRLTTAATRQVGKFLNKLQKATFKISEFRTAPDRRKGGIAGLTVDAVRDDVRAALAEDGDAAELVADASDGVDEGVVLQRRVLLLTLQSGHTTCTSVSCHKAMKLQAKASYFCRDGLGGGFSTEHSGPWWKLNVAAELDRRGPRLFTKK